jgi:hypothetical protein
MATPPDARSAVLPGRRRRSQLIASEPDNIIGGAATGAPFHQSQPGHAADVQGLSVRSGTGRKELVREITPADPVGILADNFNNFVFMTPDGRGYAYSVSRILSDLHVVEGLK